MTEEELIEEVKILQLGIAIDNLDLDTVKLALEGLRKIVQK